MYLNHFKSKRFIASICIALGMPVIAHAQTLEEIIVTAQKREESLQDTAISVAAFTGDQLERSGVTDTVGLSNLVPNVTIGTETARDGVFVSVRGISQSERRNTDDATTPINIDGASIPRMSGINSLFYDLERIEVLRGPQGTLYGKNSTSGVVNVITKKPTMDEVSGNFEASVGNFSEFTSKGAVNIPLSETLATRLAFTYSKRDGYRDNGPLVEDGDDADDLGIRGHLLWDISEDTSLLLTADYYSKDAIGGVVAAVDCANAEIGCAPLTDISANPADFNPLNTEGLRDNQDTNFKFELNHNFDSIDMVWLGSWRTHEREFLNDLDGSAGLITPPGGNPVPVIASVQETTESESFSSEFRLTSTGEGPLNWILGAYYLDETINGDFVFAPGFSTGMGNLSVRFVDKDLTYESFGVFANTNYDLTEDLTLNFGLRYTDDEKNKGGIADPTDATRGSFAAFTVLQNPNAFVGPSGPVGGPIAQIANPSWSETTWALGLDWNLPSGNLAYAKVSTGYKAGGFNRGSDEDGNPTNNVALLNIYDPETVTSYEIGWKADLLEGKGRVNLAVFYNDYEDKVESVVALIAGTPQNVAVNASDVTIYGLELESSWLYGNSGGRFDVNLGLLNATYDTFNNLPEPFLGGTIDVSGQELANAPDVTANLVWIPMEVDFMGGVLTPRIQLAYKSDYVVRPHGLSVDQQDSYTRTNASLYWEDSDGALYTELYVNNIEDEDILTVINCTNVSIGIPGVVGSAGGCQAGFQSPRTFGIKAGYRF